MGKHGREERAERNGSEQAGRATAKPGTPRTGTPRTTVDIAATWSKHRRRPTLTTRNLLVEHYRPLVQRNAEWVAGHCPPNVLLDDLVSAGAIGLIAAVAGFDPGRGVSFDRYARPRIRGAMLDELRSMDFMPRQARNRIERLNAALRTLKGRRQAPTNAELRKCLRVDQAELARMQADAGGRSMRVATDVDATADVLARADPATSAADAPLLGREAVAAILRCLTGKERRVVRLYVIEGLLMREIAGRMGYTKGRISQIYRSAMRKLRSEHGEGENEA